jgi:hypothetical protein
MSEPHIRETDYTVTEGFGVDLDDDELRETLKLAQAIQANAKKIGVKHRPGFDDGVGATERHHHSLCAQAALCHALAGEGLDWRKKPDDTTVQPGMGRFRVLARRREGVGMIDGGATPDRLQSDPERLWVLVSFVEPQPPAKPYADTPLDRMVRLYRIHGWLPASYLLKHGQHGKHRGNSDATMVSLPAFEWLPFTAEAP